MYVITHENTLESKDENFNLLNYESLNKCY